MNICNSLAILLSLLCATVYAEPGSQSEAFSPGDIEVHLRAIEGDRNPISNPENHNATRQYILSEFRTWGYQSSLQTFTTTGLNFQNVIALKPGSKPKTPAILVTAHFDTVQHSRGADDNGSGIAVMMAVADRVKSMQNYHPLIFVGMDMEEWGMEGSKAYVAEALAEQAAILAVVNLDMVGFTSTTAKQRAPSGMNGLLPEQGDFLAIVGNQNSSWLVDQAMESAHKHQLSLPLFNMTVTGNGKSLPDTRRSDHSPFWDEGYPAIMLTDTSEFRNPHYHQRTDTIETLNLDFTAQVADLVLAIIKDLDQKGESGL